MTRMDQPLNHQRLLVTVIFVLTINTIIYFAFISSTKNPEVDIESNINDDNLMEQLSDIDLKYIGSKYGNDIDINKICDINSHIPLDILKKIHFDCPSCFPNGKEDASKIPNIDLRNIIISKIVKRINILDINMLNYCLKVMNLTANNDLDNNMKIDIDFEKLVLNCILENKKEKYKDKRLEKEVNRKINKIIDKKLNDIIDDVIASYCKYNPESYENSQNANSISLLDHYTLNNYSSFDI